MNDLPPAEGPVPPGMGSAKILDFKKAAATTDVLRCRHCACMGWLIEAVMVADKTTLQLRCLYCRELEAGVTASIA